MPSGQYAVILYVNEYCLSLLYKEFQDDPFIKIFFGHVEELADHYSLVNVA